MVTVSAQADRHLSKPWLLGAKRPVTFVPVCVEHERSPAVSTASFSTADSLQRAGCC